MNLFVRIQELQKAKAVTVRIREIVVGDQVVVVQLEDEQTGVAMHFATETHSFEFVRELKHANAWEALQHLGSAHPLRAATAVAVANALVADDSGWQPGHMLDMLDLQPNDVVGMVGNFIPLVARIEPLVKQLMIFETIEQVSENGILPAYEEPRLLPKCSVIVITGTTLVNSTIEDLLCCCRNARTVVVAGPSTIMLPKAWMGTPVTWLAGSRITDPHVVMTGVRCGKSFRDLRPWLKKMVLPVPRGL